MSSVDESANSANDWLGPDIEFTEEGKVLFWDLVEDPPKPNAELLRLALEYCKDRPSTK